MDELFQKTTVRDIISAFAHDVEEKTGRPFVDFKWPNRLVYFHLINQRADIYYQTRKMNQLEGNYEDYTEVIPCVEMQEIDMVECPCAPASGCTFMKSVYPLPDFVGNHTSKVTNLNGLQVYDFVEWPMFKHRVNFRINASNQAWLCTERTINNKRWLYTYITTEMKIKARQVMVAGVPVDPMEIALYPVCGEKPKICDILDLDFVIEKRLVSTLYDQTFKKLVTYSQGTRIGDTKGDDRNAETSPDPRY